MRRWSSTPSSRRRSHDKVGDHSKGRGWGPLHLSANKPTDAQTDGHTIQLARFHTSFAQPQHRQGDLPNLCKCALELGILWVRGPFAPTSLTKIARKPTVLWVCGLRTRLRVAFGMAWVQNDRAPSSETCGFEDQFTQICFCVSISKRSLTLTPIFFIVRGKNKKGYFYSTY